MTFSIEEMIRLYLAGQRSISDVWDWLAVFQWDLTGDAEALAKEAEDAIVYYLDGFLSEEDAQVWLSTLLKSRANKTVRYTWGIPSPLPDTVVFISNSVQMSTGSYSDLKKAAYA